MKYWKEQGKSFVKILLVMYVITALMLFLLAVLMQKLQFEAKGISVGITVVYVGSCFLGGFLAGKMKGKRKFLWGLFIGVCYILVMGIVTLIVKGGTVMTFTGVLVNFLICTGAGMIGGMIS
jgi:putative membrane protein (TIGR04086 family)